MAPDGISEVISGAASDSEARFASVLDTAVDGIIVMNERCQVLAFNKACERLFGYKAAELIGQNVTKIMPADYAAAHDQYVDNYIKTGHKKIIGIGREVKGRHKDGTEFPLELSVGEASTHDERQFIGILRDLRGRKQMEERLAKAQAQLLHMTRISALDEMGAAIAHELNQPLTAVMLYLQSVTRKAKATGGLDPMIVDVIEKAAHESERASEIIQRMRQLVERKEPERDELEVVGFVKGCVELLELGAGDFHSILKVEISEGLPRLEADPVQLRQVLLNLLRNAREAVASQPEQLVKLRVDPGQGAIEFRVSDNGPGIADEMADTLFRAFSGGKNKGMGLGLAISRSIAQNHGGDLRLEPAKPGEGATFLLTIPVGDNGGLN